MIQLKMSCILLFLSTVVYASGSELSPERLATAALQIAFDRNVKLTERNDFQFPIFIDQYNRCVLTTLHPTVKRKVLIPENTEWKTESNSNWNDWDSKTYSFKLVHSNEYFLMKCELHLGGEVVLFNSNTSSRKVRAQCSKKGGYLKNTPGYYSYKETKSSRSPASDQGYCVKRVPRVTVAKITKAFRKADLSLNIGFTNDEDVTMPISEDLMRQ